MWPTTRYHHRVSTPHPTEQEAVPRGLLFSLVVIPLGIIAWLILWNFGFIASIVAWGVAFLATWLYRRGAGRIGRTGVMVVVAVTIVTLILALLAGFAWDVAVAVEQEFGVPWTTAIGMPEFWQDTVSWMFHPSNLLTLILAIGFGFLGCFWTLRQLSRATNAVGQGGAGSTTTAGATETTSGQLGSGQLGTGQTGRDQLGTGQTGRDQLGSGQTGRDQLGSGQTGRDQLGSGQTGRDQEQPPPPSSSQGASGL